MSTSVYERCVGHEQKKSAMVPYHALTDHPHCTVSMHGVVLHGYVGDLLDPESGEFIPNPDGQIVPDPTPDVMPRGDVAVYLDPHSGLFIPDSLIPFRERGDNAVTPPIFLNWDFYMAIMTMHVLAGIDNNSTFVQDYYKVLTSDATGPNRNKPDELTIDAVDLRVADFAMT
jgi:hypothetical protein